MYHMSDALRRYIEENGIKQSYLARQSGLSPDRLSLLLRDKRRLRADEMMEMCDVLRIQPGDLARRYGQNP